MVTSLLILVVVASILMAFGYRKLPGSGFGKAIALSCAIVALCGLALLSITPDYKGAAEKLESWTATHDGDIVSLAEHLAASSVSVAMIVDFKVVDVRPDTPDSAGHAAVQELLEFAQVNGIKYCLFETSLLRLEFMQVPGVPGTIYFEYREGAWRPGRTVLGR